MIPSVIIKPASLFIGAATKSIAWKFLFKLHPELIGFNLPVAVNKPVAGQTLVAPDTLKQWARDALEIHISRWKDSLLSTTTAQAFGGGGWNFPPMPHSPFTTMLSPAPAPVEEVIWPEEDPLYLDDPDEEEP